MYNVSKDDNISNLWGYFDSLLVFFDIFVWRERGVVRVKGFI